MDDGVNININININIERPIAGIAMGMLLGNKGVVSDDDALIVAVAFFILLVARGCGP
jgi:hypothetical protein